MFIGESLFSFHPVLVCAEVSSRFPARPHGRPRRPRILVRLVPRLERARDDRRVDTLAELVALAKAKPGKLNFAISGVALRQAGGRKIVRARTRSSARKPSRVRRRRGATALRVGLHVHAQPYLYLSCRPDRGSPAPVAQIVTFHHLLVAHPSLGVHAGEAVALAKAKPRVGHLCIVGPGSWAFASELLGTRRRSTCCMSGGHPEGARRAHSSRHRRTRRRRRAPERIGAARRMSLPPSAPTPSPESFGANSTSMRRW
jgi:hypothetical protein